MSLAALTPPRALNRLSSRMTLASRGGGWNSGYWKVCSFKDTLLVVLIKMADSYRNVNVYFNSTAHQANWSIDLFWFSKASHQRGTVCYNVVKYDPLERQWIRTDNTVGYEKPKRPWGKNWKCIPQLRQRHKHFEVWKASHWDKIRVKILE